ncbi:MAG: hypothetical protein D8M58_02000 [Calditrichaeota bacterium]|nr:MAG: hypothetical protein DWQ03_05080 [Calditrichota bacterium]MBL1204141.1 hypothetical protein [Calditrichota bacterium]NOG43972.1 tetratricopeptide repeat protein [Calditrichota bacterium]
MKTIFILALALFFTSNIYAQNKVDLHYNILDEAFKELKQNSQIDYLIDEFENFVFIYPNSKQEDEILYRLSHLYSLKNQPSQQIIPLIKLNILHGNSPLRKRSIEIIDSLVTFSVDFTLSEQSEKTLQQLSNIPVQENYRLAYLDYLSFIYSLDYRKMDELFFGEISLYKKLFASFEEDMDAIIFWQANIYKVGKKHPAAIFNFDKVCKLYKKSRFVPQALLELAILNRDYLNNINQTRDYLLEIINQYPDAAKTGDAQYELAKLYDHNYKDTDEALKNYELHVSAFPNNPNYSSSLMRIAAIYEMKENYIESINSYKRIVEKNHNEEATFKALKIIIRLYEKKLNDNKLTAKTMILFAQTFPQNEESLGFLFSAGKLYLEKIEDKIKAKEVFEIIIAQFPESTEAKEAADILKKLSEADK